ncbi:MAG: LLM class F420-dependent oxidoreductase [Deltaproteobacteria bacterium]|nr:LLM class F420-dependent oxidoreductase [Deltaproteobacteria bacterium]MBW2415968.1 LLM class F420-dependent oxidoreductase [Deltaproteobacteria bacterium]
MKLGIMAAAFGKKLQINMDLILHAERLGFDSAWTAEAYGSDAVTTATWIGARTERIKVGTAIMQMPARTPAMTAMTAMSLDHLTGGRFILGLGPSGPQVAEGWHGMPYGKPLTRTREYIEIIRAILAREKPLEHHGAHYDIPVTGEGTTGLGKPLKSILHGDPALKIYTASISPAGLRCAAEVADGVFPMMMDPEQYDRVLGQHLDEGFAKAGGGKGLDNFDVCPMVSVIVSDDVEKARVPVKMQLALYIGGMGARDKNFYNDYAKRLGYEEAAVEIQDQFLAGNRMEAMQAVPDELVDRVHLIGSADAIRDRLGAWRDAAKNRHVDTMLIGAGQPEALELVAKELL